MKARQRLGAFVSEKVLLPLSRLMFKRSSPGPRSEPWPSEADRPTAAPGPSPPADERTIRRIAEAQAGGISSQESDERYARGENPGGTHHRAVRHEGPEHQRPELEEPQAREETIPGRGRHMPATRRGP